MTRILATLAVISACCTSLAQESTSVQAAQLQLQRALVALELQEAQREPFAEMTQEFFADVRRTVARGLRRNFDRDRIGRRVEGVFEALDEPAREIFSEQQWPAFLAYKAAVADYMRVTGQFGPETEVAPDRMPSTGTSTY